LGSPERALGSHDTRDTVVDFIAEWSRKTEIAQERFIRWVGVSRGKFFDWKERYGKANEHNGKVPRDHWLEKWEQQAILAYHRANPLEGYRRMTFMMLDEGIVAVSPASVYRVLNAAGLLDRWNQKPSKKGTGFEQPSRAHEHWPPAEGCEQSPQRARRYQLLEQNERRHIAARSIESRTGASPSRARRAPAVPRWPLDVRLDSCRMLSECAPVAAMLLRG
jgi:hypothetical protein